MSQEFHELMTEMGRVNNEIDEYCSDKARIKVKMMEEAKEKVYADTRYELAKEFRNNPNTWPEQLIKKYNAVIGEISELAKSGGLRDKDLYLFDDFDYIYRYSPVVIDTVLEANPGVFTEEGVEHLALKLKHINDVFYGEDACDCELGMEDEDCFEEDVYDCGFGIKDESESGGPMPYTILNKVLSLKPELVNQKSFNLLLDVLEMKLDELGSIGGCYGIRQYQLDKSMITDPTPLFNYLSKSDKFETLLKESKLTDGQKEYFTKYFKIDFLESQ